jgi:carbamate kinase
MRVVLALGGNALLRRGEPLTEEAQRRNARAAAAAVAAVATRHQAVITHGNGPQVGLLALESEAYKDVPAYGLAALVAESQGMIGFLLQEALRNQLPDACIATLLTSVLVDADDPALKQATKPVGPVYGEKEALRLAAERGWQVRRDGEAYRRVVPSPPPRQLLEMPAVRALVDAGVLLICAGGGGVPFAQDAGGRLTSVEAVVDKDLTSALLAEELKADALLLLTDVGAVLRGWGTLEAEPMPEASIEELRAMRLEAGSMGPKAEAACRFVERTGGLAVIGALADAAAMLEGRAGTIVTP